MAATQRVTNEEVVNAYRATGSVWKAAKLLGICGQSAWERLRAIGHPMSCRRWTQDEVAELKTLVASMTLCQAARQLGRSYASVASKLSLIGHTNIKQSPPKGLFAAPKRGSGITRDIVKGWAREVLRWQGSLKQFAADQGVRLEMIAVGLQRHYPDVWAQVVPRLDVPPRPCPQCGNDFIPATPKQRCCCRKCTYNYRRDQQYFGGKRSQTIGLAEGVCQLCLRKVGRGLSSHHLIGKENDPENELLVALCQGCHQVVGMLGGRTFIDGNEGWERLIEFALLRRFGDARGPHAGFQVSVDIDWLTEDEIKDLEELYEVPA